MRDGEVELLQESGKSSQRDRDAGRMGVCV